MSSEPPADSPAKALAVDANILISAILGTRVPAILDQLLRRVAIVAPEEVYADAERHLPPILRARRVPDDAVAEVRNQLVRLRGIIVPTAHDVYAPLEERARQRMRRDPDDWPLVALALYFRCPIWTQDRDFTGSGIATWTTATVLLYLED